MDKKYFVFPSVTMALRAMSSLKKTGIHANLQKMRSAIISSGCSYVLGVDERILDAAKDFLLREGVRIVDILDNIS